MHDDFNGGEKCRCVRGNYLFIYELALTYIDQAVMLTNPKRRKNINKMRKDKKQNLDKEEKEKKNLFSPLFVFLLSSQMYPLSCQNLLILCGKPF